MDNPAAPALDSVAEPTVDDAATRFSGIYSALGPGSRWWNDSAWLRFSAQSAVMRRESPIETARAIESAAERLYQHAHWYDALASPLNLVVAATLVQTSDTVDAFTADVASTSLLLREAGIHLSGSLLIKTILISRVLAGGSPTTKLIIDRMHQIYLQMKKRHWWLTGRGEVPICALLSYLQETPEEIADTVENIYMELNEHHLTSGRDLLTTAHLLVLRGLPGNDTKGRFIAMVELLNEKSSALFPSDYNGIALLSLLDHEPDLILLRLEKMKETLADLAPLQFTEVNFTIAAELAYLDLIGVDRELHPFSHPDDLQRVERLTRLERATSLLLVNVPSISAVEGGSTRWQA
jgi:hypothetical protein